MSLRAVHDNMALDIVISRTTKMYEVITSRTTRMYEVVTGRSTIMYEAVTCTVSGTHLFKTQLIR